MTQAYIHWTPIILCSQEHVRTTFSAFEYEDFEEEQEEVQEEESEAWTVSTVDENASEEKKMKPSESSALALSKSLSKMMSKSFSRFLSRVMSKASADKAKSVASEIWTIQEDSDADSYDDLNVHIGDTLPG